MTQTMTTETTPRDALTVFKKQITVNEQEFKAALPTHIPIERFMRVVTTAVTSNPDLLAADRRSLFESAVKAAQDGLLPDGREGALVVFNSKVKIGGRDQWIAKVQWMPMIGGILKKIRNSGLLLSISAHVVYRNDEFDFELGDDERISHRPAMEDRGPPRAVYAIAKTKDGGIYREVMTVEEVERVRAVSRSKDKGPWVQWWTEMARKTVLRRLSKRLPMSSDLDDLIRRDDALYDFESQKDSAQIAPSPRSLVERMDALAGVAAEYTEALEGEGEEIETTDGVDPETGEIVEQGTRTADAAE